MRSWPIGAKHRIDAVCGWYRRREETDEGNETEEANICQPVTIPGCREGELQHETRVVAAAAVSREIESRAIGDRP